MSAQQMTAQQIALTNSLMQQQQQQQRREGMKGQCLLKLMQFGEHLSGYPVGSCAFTFLQNFY
jgi:hypothetical protein